MCIQLFQMLAWRTELEHSEVRAEAALVTILSLTQVTELKLLLDCGPESHRFYTLVLSLLITAIALEIVVGAVVIYIGGIHRTKPPRPTTTAVGLDDDDDGLLLASRHRSPWRQENIFWSCLCCRRVNRRSTLKSKLTSLVKFLKLSAV
jgi:Ninjurin